MDHFDTSTYGERFADVYDEWYGGISDLEGTVSTVELLADGAPVLELGIGTGRVAVPLAARGVEVEGIDASPAMVERMRAKPGGDAIPVAIGDFAGMTVPSSGTFGVVFVAFNTLFNLSSRDAQERCFATAAVHLRPGGAFVVEAFVPTDEGPDHSVTPSIVGVDQVVLQATRRDRAAQTLTGSVISITEGGTRLRPWQIRYAGPAELDGMAAAAGLVLEARWAGWREEPFDDDSPRHVTVYLRPSG